MWSPVICLKWINVPPQCSSYNPFPNTRAAAFLYFFFFLQQQELFTGCQLGIIGAAIFENKNKNVKTFLLQRSSCSIVGYDSHFTAIGGRKKVVLKKEGQAAGLRHTKASTEAGNLLTNPRKSQAPRTPTDYKWGLSQPLLWVKSVKARYWVVLKSYRNLSTPGIKDIKDHHHQYQPLNAKK